MSDTSVNHHPIPAVLPNETPGSCPPPEVHALLTDVFFAPLRAIVKTSGIIRKCICRWHTIFLELKNWEVWAVDGHQIAHATHDPRNGKDQYSPVSAIYRLDSRTGWAEFTALVKPTAKGLEHEIITLRRLSSEALRCGAGKGQHTLISYDRAIIDFVYAWVLCETYRLRWRIEKSFDQQEQKLDERKAWATSDTAKTIQVISFCIANNLLQLFKATLKTEEGIEDTKVIKASHKDLDRREANAKKSGRPFPKALFLDLYRPTELSLQFIRWLRTALTIPTCYRQALERLHPLMESYL